MAPPLIEHYADQYDPRVASRILKGRDISDEDLRQLRTERSALIEAVSATARGFDALIMPAVPIVAPPYSVFEQDAGYVRLNALMLRNPSLANFLDRCSISLPIHQARRASGRPDADRHHGGDGRLFATARAIERALA